MNKERRALDLPVAARARPTTASAASKPTTHCRTAPVLVNLYHHNAKGNIVCSPRIRIESEKDMHCIVVCDHRKSMLFRPPSTERRYRDEHLYPGIAAVAQGPSAAGLREVGGILS